jgi:hypothetical protein
MFLSITLLCPFAATIIIRILAVEEIGIFSLAVNAIIQLLAVSGLLAIGGEDPSLVAVLFRMGVSLLLLEAAFFITIILAFSGSHHHPIEDWVFISAMSLLPVRIIYFIILFAGDKDVRNAMMLKNAPMVREEEGEAAEAGNIIRPTQS